MKKYSSITRVNSHRISRNNRIINVVALLCVVLLALYVTPKLLSKVASVVFTPIYATENWLQNSGESFPYFFRDRMALVAEIRALKALTPEGGVHKVAINALTHENEELRRLGLADAPHRILAGVIGRPPEMPYDVLIIDRGGDDGVVEGAPVYSAKTAVIGVVARVYAKSAVVELLTSPGFKTAVYLYGPNIFAQAEGEGGGVLRVGVPQGITIKPGDIAVVPSVDLGVFGEVTHIESLPTDPAQYGFVTPNVALQSLRLVTVGRVPLEPISYAEAQMAVAQTITTLFEVPIPTEELFGGVGATSSATSTSHASTTAYD